MIRCFLLYTIGDLLICLSLEGFIDSLRNQQYINAGSKLSLIILGIAVIFAIPLNW